MSLDRLWRCTRNSLSEMGVLVILLTCSGWILIWSLSHWSEHIMILLLLVVVPGCSLSYWLTQIFFIECFDYFMITAYMAEPDNNLVLTDGTALCSCLPGQTFGDFELTRRFCTGYWNHSIPVFRQISSFHNLAFTSLISKWSCLVWLDHLEMLCWLFKSLDDITFSIWVI